MWAGWHPNVWRKQNKQERHIYAKLLINLKMDRRLTRMRINTVNRRNVGDANNSFKTVMNFSCFGSNVFMLESMLESGAVAAADITISGSPSVCSGDVDALPSSLAPLLLVAVVFAMVRAEAGAMSSSSSILISLVQKKVINTDAILPHVQDRIKKRIPVQDVSPICTWSGRPMTKASTMKPDSSAATFIMA
jgi:hypothetical protein